MNCVYIYNKEDKKASSVCKVLNLLGYETHALAGQDQQLKNYIAVYSIDEDYTRGGKYLVTSDISLSSLKKPEWVNTPYKIGVKKVVKSSIPKIEGILEYVYDNNKIKLDKPSKSLVDLISYVSSIYVISYRIDNWYPGSLVDPAYWIDPIAANAGSSKISKHVKTWSKRASDYTNKNKDVSNCSQIKQKLLKTRGYYVHNPESSFKVTPDFIKVENGELEAIQRNGDLIKEFWKTSLKVYRDSLKGDPSLLWVPKSIEGPISSEQILLQRKIAFEQRNLLPSLYRADLSSIWNLVEIQERLGGLGLVDAWLSSIREVMGTEGLLGSTKSVAENFADIVRDKTGKKNPVLVLIYPQGYHAEQKYFSNKLRRLGIDSHIVLKTSIGSFFKYDSGGIYISKNNKRVDYIYRREVNAATLAKSDIGRRISKASIEGNLIVEPPLNMIYDCKSPLAWVHHPETAHYYSSKVKKIITPTALMPDRLDAPFVLDGKELTLRETVGEPYVIKYAGENIKVGLGGRGVYNVLKDGKILDYAISEIRKGHPWIIQPYDRTRKFVRYCKNGQLSQNKVALRLMIHYMTIKDSTSLLAACATNRPHWKAIGSSDSIFQEIRKKA